jgi:hypothetical protein
VSLGGVLAVTFVPTFLRELRFSKVAEASQKLDDIYRRAATYYAHTRVVDGVSVRGCVPASAGPTPALPSAAPQWTDFVAANVNGHATWAALGLSEPEHVRYTYEASFAVDGCAPHASAPRPAAVFRAIGDLDGDGVLSTLSREAVLGPEQEALLPDGPLHVERRTE